MSHLGSVDNLPQGKIKSYMIIPALRKIINVENNLE